MAPLSNEQVDQLRREHVDTLVRVMEANSDLEDRFRASEVSIEIDLEDDLLAITLGGQQEALTVDIDDGVYFRVDPDTYKLVGIEVWHPHQRIAEDTAVGRIVAKALQATGSRITVVRPTSTITTSLNEDVRALVGV